MKKIDFVITWVDGNDPEWRAEKAKYRPETAGDAVRYRDWDNLQYWFRGVEKFAPWVNRIHFVTWGHLPGWLNTSHSKLNIVNHKDYIPEKYLPVFSANPIELNLYRIHGLEEQFVFFNDDMFLIRKMEPEDFFKKGLPRDCCIETALAQDDIDNPFAHILMNDAALANMHYNKKQVIRKHFRKWFHPAYGAMVLRNVLMLPYREFSSFKYTHLPSAFLKETYEKIWSEEGEVLDRVCRNRFRSPEDVNQYVIKYWQYLEGKYEPQSPSIGRFYTIGKDDPAILNTIRRQFCKMICLNDDAGIHDFEKTKKEIQDAFLSVLPERSSFEIS